MPVSVQIRESETGESQEITLDELKERIRSGELGPSVQFRDSYWTGNEWWTLDNLRIFHNLSPKYHAPGSHLASKLRREKEAEVSQEAIRAWQRKVTESLPDDFLERSYGTKKVTTLWAERPCIGIARLVERPAFSSPKLTTLAFGSNSVDVDVLEANRSPYGEFGAAYGTPHLPLPDWNKVAAEFSAECVDSWKNTIGLNELPKVIRNWEAVVKIAHVATDCSTLTLDGVSFVHEIVDADVHVTATWSNPDRQDHSPQTSLVSAYRSFGPGWFGRI